MPLPGQVSRSKAHPEPRYSPKEQSRLVGACAEADAEIDRIVYALYGLTDEGIAVVEGAN